MNRKKSSFIFAISLLLLTTACGIPGFLERRANADRWKKTTAKQFVKISELREQKRDGTIYETEGYVVDSMPECDCPIGQGCKCYPASITISEIDNPRKSRDLSKNEIRINTKSPEVFKQNQKYRFKIDVSEYNSDDKLLKDVSLIAYRLEETTTGKTMETDGSPLAATETNASLWDKTTAKEFLTITELKKKNPRGGIYETEGYIVDSVPKCHCPPPRLCKCRPPSVTISEVFETPRSREVGPKQLRILMNPKGLGGDKKYRFKIEIPDTYSDNEKIDDVFIVAYRAP